MDKHIFFEITDICNESCIHCDKRWRKNGGHVMNRAMLDNILAIPKDFLCISGGEPALAKEQVKYIVENCDVPVCINTNLTLWDDNDFRMFNERNVGLAVSVVALKQETYKKITGKDLVHKLKENLEKIWRGNRITIVINNENIDELEYMVNYLAVRGFYRFIIQPAIPGMGDKFEYAQYLKRVAKLKQVYQKHRHMDIKCMCHYDCAYSDVPATHECEAGQKRIAILSNGDVVPCACMTPVVLGNIMTTPWEKIEANGEKYFESFPEGERYMCKGFLTVASTNK